MTDLVDRLQQVHQRMLQAATFAGRPAASVKLLAVSKTFSAQVLRTAYAAGQKAFAENYVQEAHIKIAALEDVRAELEWHFIGAIQRNKTRCIALHFDWVHTVDQLSTAIRLSEQRPEHLPPLNICLQVNISREPQKNGVMPEQLEALAHAVAVLPRLRLRGLMALPKAVVGEYHTLSSECFDASAAALSLDAYQSAIQEVQRLPYREVHHLYNALREQGFALDTLSLGTSADLEAAVLEGATMVRVGSAIFGEREKRL